MSASRESRLYPNAPPRIRSPRIGTNALSISIPLTSAGELWTTDSAHSTSNSEFVTAGGSSDSFSSDAGFSAAAGPLASAPTGRPEMMRGKRPQFGRSISYPYQIRYLLSLKYRLLLTTLTDSWPSMSPAPDSFAINENFGGTSSLSLDPSAVSSPVMAPSRMKETTLPVDSTPLDKPPNPISSENPRFVNLPTLEAWQLPLRLVPPTGPVDSILIGIL